MIPAWVPAVTQGLEAWFQRQSRKGKRHGPPLAKGVSREKRYQQMYRLRRQGLSYVRIAQLLGVHRSTVQRRTCNVGRRWALAEKVRRLRGQGMLWKDIAKKIGVALVTIHRKRRQGYV